MDRDCVGHLKGYYSKKRVVIFVTRTVLGVKRTVESPRYSSLQNRHRTRLDVVIESDGVRVLSDKRSEDVWILDGSDQGHAEVIGLVSLTRMDRKQSEINLIAPAFWHTGFASEAVAAMVAANPHWARMLFRRGVPGQSAFGPGATNNGFDYLGDAETHLIAAARRCRPGPICAGWTEARARRVRAAVSALPRGCRQACVPVGGRRDQPAIAISGSSRKMFVDHRLGGAHRRQPQDRSRSADFLRHRLRRGGHGGPLGSAARLHHAHHPARHDRWGLIMCAPGASSERRPAGGGAGQGLRVGQDQRPDDARSRQNASRLPPPAFAM